MTHFRSILLLMAGLASIGALPQPAISVGRGWRAPMWGGFAGVLVQPPQEALEPTPAVPPPAPAPRPETGRRRAAGRHARPPGPAVMGTGACGGVLPTCRVLACESGGNLHAHNPSGADGKWQFMNWNGYGGYSSASAAPEHVQDAKAREMWAGGRGASHWRACL